MAAIWGTNWVWIKDLSRDGSPFVLSALRVAIATVVLFAFVVVLRRPLRTTPVWPTFVAGMLQSGIFIILQSFALVTGGVGKTAILTYTMPLWVALLAPAVLGERIGAVRAVALGLALVGLACLLTPLDLEHALISKVLALATAVVWAAGVLYTKVFRRTYECDTLTFTAWQMLYSLPPVALAALVVPGAYLHPSANFFPELISVAAGGTAIAFLLWMVVVARLSAGTAGLASLLVPVTSIAAAALLLGERPTPLESVGIGAILAGLALNCVPPRFGLNLRGGGDGGGARTQRDAAEIH